MSWCLISEPLQGVWGDAGLEMDTGGLSAHDGINTPMGRSSGWAGPWECRRMGSRRCLGVSVAPESRVRQPRTQAGGQGSGSCCERDTSPFLHAFLHTHTRPVASPGTAPTSARAGPHPDSPSSLLLANSLSERRPGHTPGPKAVEMCQYWLVTFVIPFKPWPLKCPQCPGLAHGRHSVNV